MRLPRLHLLAGLASALAVARAASFDERVELLFRPLQGGMIALSPDGQRVAYTVSRGGELSLVVMGVEPPGPRRPVKVEPERDPAEAGELAPRLRLLRWATSSRLVYGPAERIVPLPPVTEPDGRTAPNPDGPTILAPILLVDVDGRERGTLVDANNFQETPESARQSLADLLRTPQQLAAVRKAPVGWRMPHLDVIGFLPRDREQMVLLTHGGHSLPRQHLVDLRSGDVREFGGDWPAPPGEPQVFDGYRLRTVGERVPAARPTTLWRDEELAGAQRELEAKFPRRVVELLDWSETRARVLARVTGGSDPGRIFVWQRPEDVVVEILPCAPWLGATKLNPTRFFECAAPDGARLSGYVTRPAKPAAEPPPLLVIFPSGFPGHAQPAFDPEAQVFADLGFAVARLNHRSVAGVGPKDLAALRTAPDRVAVNDAQAVLAWLASRPAPLARGRVVAFGRGFGGYLALRALQLAPAAFSAGVAIDAPLDLRAWLSTPAAAAHDVPAALLVSAGADGKKFSVLEHPDAMTAPALLCVEPGRNAAIDAATAEWRARLAALGRAADVVELDAGFAAGRASARAAVYRRIGEFLGPRLRGAGGEGGVAGMAKESP